MSDKLQAVKALLEEHNSAVGKRGNVSIKAFLDCIRVQGGTTDERLKRFSYEDILQCLPLCNAEVDPGISHLVKPIVLAKDIANIFRGKETEEGRPVSKYQAERMTVRELVEHLDPEDPNNAVAQRLKELTRSEPCIVFEADRKVDVERTVKLIEELKQGYPAIDSVDVEGLPRPVYRIGELPDAFVEENPLYPGRPLRPGGACDQTGRSWEGVSLEVRQLVRVAVDIRELEVAIDTAHAVLDIAISSEAMEKLRGRYRKASLKFDELGKAGKLPTLSVQLRGKKPVSLESGHKVDWR